MRKTILIVVIIAILAVTVSVILISARSRAAAMESARRQPQVDQPQTISGPGLVEPLSEDIKLGSELSGKLKAVYVEEGDHVTSGQLLAELQNDDYRAQIGSAEAQVIAKEATLRKVVNGARAQERSEAMSSARAAEAVMNNARAEMERRQKLFDAGVISREENERYARECDVARAKYEEAAQRHSLVDDRAREEDQAFAEADLRLARASLEEARARYAKTLLKSPIDGTVLRKHHRNGDETEIGKVQVGQRAYVTADAFAGHKFWGRVVRVGEQLGRKNVRTDEPTERVDTKILETLVELDKGAQLPVGLRMDAFILGGSPQVASIRADQ
ncbi:MAG: secretion protein HlyD [Acidobacteria bacterium]|nr:MAG: secretion protein HlyD [Acidobacteriota bacterium]